MHVRRSVLLGIVWLLFAASALVPSWVGTQECLPDKTGTIAPQPTGLELKEVRTVSCGVFLEKSSGPPMPLVDGVERLLAVDINRQPLVFDSASGIDSVVWYFRERSVNGVYIEGNRDPREGWVRIGVMQDSPRLTWDTDWQSPTGVIDSLGQAEYLDCWAYTVVGWVYRQHEEVCNTAPIVVMPADMVR